MRYIDKRRYEPFTPETIPLPTRILLFVGALAIAPIILSTGSTANSSGSLGLQVFGLSLAALAPILGGIQAINFLFVDHILYGKDPDGAHDWSLIRKLRRNREKKSITDLEYERKQFEIEESVAAAGHVLARILALPLALVLATIEQGGVSGFFSWSFAGGIGAGLLFAGPGGMLIRRAHLISDNRIVISLLYLTPVLSIVWLSTYRTLEVPRLDLLLFGSVAVVAINMLINVDPEAAPALSDSPGDSLPVDDEDPNPPPASSTKPINERLGLKALVIALIGTGMIVYYRDELFPTHEFKWAAGDYWAILALASTVFALLLAFRITRIENLLSAENYRTFEIIRRVEMLPSWLFGNDDDNTKQGLLLAVRQLNQAHSTELYQTSYYSCRTTLDSLVGRDRNAPVEDADATDQPDADSPIEGDLPDSLHSDEVPKNEIYREIAEISRDIDSLAYGRQHGREFSERIALLLIGCIIVVFALAVPVQPSNLAQLFTECFAILLSSVVIFLLFHLADLRRSRSDELLTSRRSSQMAIGSPAEHLYVRFRDERDLKWQRAFAATIIFGVALALFGIFAWDRLGYA